jgi:hypothetical protein
MQISSDDNLNFEQIRDFLSGFKPEELAKFMARLDMISAMCKSTMTDNLGKKDVNTLIEKEGRKLMKHILQNVCEKQRFNTNDAGKLFDDIMKGKII